MSEKKIKKLNDFDHARLRTEMYLSSRDPHTQTVLTYGKGSAPVPVETTWVPAVFVAFREIFDNALDEVITHKNGNTIEVTYNEKTRVFSIKDNGRGIPIEKDPTHNQYQATMAVADKQAGRNFEDRGDSRGLNGVGASIVNFCSEYFQMDIHRDKVHFSQRFCEGKTDLKVEDPIILPTNVKTTGTRIEFKLSSKVFHDMTLPVGFIRDRMVEASLCYPTLKIVFNGEKIAMPAKSDAGKVLFGNTNPIFIEMLDEGFESRFWLVPQFFKEGTEFTHSLVNAIPMFNGGTHVEAFRRNFFSGMIKALERESKRRKLTPNRSDIADGMLLFNITQMDAPSFDSQSKTRIINANVGTIVTKNLDNPDFFKNVIKKNPDWINQIYEKCAERTLKKDDADAKKDAKRNLRTKVEELEDACGVDRSKCILFLGEGRSAISGMVEARDPNIHGGLPLRGKVLNVHGESNKTILANEALAKIMSSIGLAPGVRANRHNLRYGKVYITTDADEDGKNIAALLINFFYTLWPELFEDDKPPFIYVFDTPLIVAAKGKNRKYWYNENYQEFDPSEHKGWEITRAKGLAALKKDDWKWVLANPKAREITDDGKLEETLNLLFNPKLADMRKEWIGM